MFLDSKSSTYHGDMKTRRMCATVLLPFATLQIERKSGHLSCNGDMVPDRSNVICKGNSVVNYLIFSVCLIHMLTESWLSTAYSYLISATKRLKDSVFHSFLRKPNWKTNQSTLRRYTVWSLQEIRELRKY